MNSLRIVFFGTPDFAVASLQALADGPHEVVAVVTAPDKPAGRGHRLQPSAVKQRALELGYPILQPAKLKDKEFISTLRDYHADLQIVVAFRMLPEVVWNMPPLGTYNVHASLLPKYRGAAPIHHAIINGETITGVTTFKLKHEIDTGNLLLQKKISIGENETTGELYERLMLAGAELLSESVDLIAAGNVQLHPQPSLPDAPHAPKIHKADCEIDWDQSADGVHNFIRGMSPFPGAYTKVQLPDGTTEQWKIYTSRKTERPSLSLGQWCVEDNRVFVHCADVQIEVLQLQPPGKRRLMTEEWLAGIRFDVDQVKSQLKT